MIRRKLVYWRWYGHRHLYEVNKPHTVKSKQVKSNKKWDIVEEGGGGNLDHWTFFTSKFHWEYVFKDKVTLFLDQKLRWMSPHLVHRILRVSDIQKCFYGPGTQNVKPYILLGPGLIKEQRFPPNYAWILKDFGQQISEGGHWLCRCDPGVWGWLSDYGTQCYSVNWSSIKRNMIFSVHITLKKSPK